MGCLCYFHGKNMIAFLVTDGIVISKLSEQETNELSKLSKKIGFKMGGTTVRKPVRELKTQENLRTILPFLKKSYRATGSQEIACDFYPMYLGTEEAWNDFRTLSTVSSAVLLSA